MRVTDERPYHLIRDNINLFSRVVATQAETDGWSTPIHSELPLQPRHGMPSPTSESHADPVDTATRLSPISKA